MTLPQPRSYRATDPLRWAPRTFADECRETGQPVPRVAVCRCGRRVPALVLVDVRALPVSVRGAQEWACDGCWTGWMRTARITRDAWLEQLGAPAELRSRLGAKPCPYTPSTRGNRDSTIDGAVLPP